MFRMNGMSRWYGCQGETMTISDKIKYENDADKILNRKSGKKYDN